VPTLALAALASATLAPSLAGCGEPEPEVTPVTLDGPRPVAEDAPSPYVTSPHANLRLRSAVERAREQAALEREALRRGRSGAGGGGGVDFTPELPALPDARETERYRRELDRKNVV
jgi:hypothetical protein